MVLYNKIDIMYGVTIAHLVELQGLLVVVWAKHSSILKAFRKSTKQQ